MRLQAMTRRRRTEPPLQLDPCHQAGSHSFKSTTGGREDLGASKDTRPTRRSSLSKVAAEANRHRSAIPYTSLAEASPSLNTSTSARRAATTGSRRARQAEDSSSRLEETRLKQESLPLNSQPFRLIRRDLAEANPRLAGSDRTEADHRRRSAGSDHTEADHRRRSAGSDLTEADRRRRTAGSDPQGSTTDRVATGIAPARSPRRRGKGQKGRRDPSSLETNIQETPSQWR